MKKFALVLAALVVSASAWAAAPDCSKFNMQLSYNAVEPIHDIVAGKIVGSVRMYSDRCERAGQTLDVVFSGDASDPVTHKRRAHARILLSRVSSNVAWTGLTDAMAKTQGLANVNELRAFLTGIYAKDAQGNPKKDDKGNVIDITKETWTFIEFSLVR